MSEEWGPWIEHDGKGCPCVGQYAHWVYDRPALCEKNPRAILQPGGMTCVGYASGGKSWFWDPAMRRVIRYRIRKPRALLDLIERARELDDAPEGPIRAPAKEQVTG